MEEMYDALLGVSTEMAREVVTDRGDRVTATQDVIASTRMGDYLGMRPAPARCDYILASLGESAFIYNVNGSSVYI
jgi:hypothetical protein